MLRSRVSLIYLEMETGSARSLQQSLDRHQSINRRVAFLDPRPMTSIWGSIRNVLWSVSKLWIKPSLLRCACIMHEYQIPQGRYMGTLKLRIGTSKIEILSWHDMLYREDLAELHFRRRWRKARNTACCQSSPSIRDVSNCHPVSGPLVE